MQRDLRISLLGGVIAQLERSRQIDTDERSSFVRARFSQVK